MGSERKSPEFNRDFLPRREFLRRRWQSIDIAHYEAKSLPAIKVFEVGGVFFVRDGNHRVSVAHALKWSFIDAEVVRVKADVALEPGMGLKEVADAARRAHPAPANWLPREGAPGGAAWRSRRAQEAGVVRYRRTGLLVLFFEHVRAGLS